VYEDITPESIKQDILSNMKIDVDKQREGSYTNELISPVATELWKFYTAFNALIPIAFVDETSGGYIDKRAAEVNIFRKAGTKAHAELTLTGEDRTVIPAGTVFLTPDGLEYETADKATILGGTATANAVEVGEAYNVAAGSITNQYNSMAGLSSVTNAKAAAGGTDPETDESLVNRYYAYIQKPSTSGNIHDYEKWALEVDGVGAVKVTPLQNGPGTVGILIAGPQRQPVGTDIVSACAAHIEEHRPIGATVTAASAKSLTISVSAAVTIDSSTTKETVQETLKTRIDEYLKDIAFENYTVLYNHVAYLLLGIDGVSDYMELKVNDGTSNITIAADEVPVLGTVEVT